MNAPKPGEGEMRGTCGVAVDGTAGGRRWGFWAVVVGSMLAVGLLGARIARVAAREKPVMQLLEAMHTGTGAERRRARTELVGLTSEAAPVLVRLVRQGKTRWQSEVMPWFESIPQIGRYRSRALAHERNAIEVLQRMGPGVAPALLPLLDEDRYGGREAAIALLRVYGPTVVPLLHGALADPATPRRIGAALALGRFRGAEQGGLSALIRARQDPNASVRSAVVWSLGQMQESGAEVVPELVAALEDVSVAVQLQAVQMLRGFEAGAVPAVEGLRRVLREGSEELQAEAALTLATVGEGARAASSELLVLAQGNAVAPARQAAGALVELGVHRDTGLDRLRALLGSPEVQVRVKTAETLSGLGPKAADLVPDLLRLLENEEAADDRPVVLALRQIQPAAIPERFRRGRPAR